MILSAIFSAVKLKETADTDLWGFGNNDDLLVSCKKDLQLFKGMTDGCTLIMGRKTFESLGSRTLPGRLSIVITSQEGLKAPGCLFVRSLDTAVHAAAEVYGAKVAYVIGGAKLIEQVINERRAAHLYVSVFQTNRVLTLDDAEVTINLQDILPAYKEFRSTSATLQGLSVLGGPRREGGVLTFIEYEVDQEAW